ncbi:MAG TPA: hypothetical protein VFL90_06220 [Methylomirabilota bacterium]|nr:hypothetical protein [Methylomirabilota bacterium]
MIVAAVVVVGGGRFCARKLPHGLSQPGLAMQLAASREDVEQIVGLKIWCAGASPAGARPDCLANASTLYAQQWRDVVFIPIYVAFQVLIGALVWRSGRFRLLAALGIVAVVIAGLADARENVAIIRILGPDPVCTVMPRPWALLKWRLLTLVLAANAALLVRTSATLRGLGRWAAYAAAALAVATLYFVGMQLLWADDTYLETALPVVAATAVMLWLAVAGLAWFPAGLLPALDVLARETRARRIAAWPEPAGPGPGSDPAAAEDQVTRP